MNLLLLPQTLFFGIAGIIGVGFLIGFHELGHFLFCKLFHIRTPSFSIGIGPKLIEKKIGDTNFALSAIPLGGYVEIAGAAEVGQGDQLEAKRVDEYSFASKPYWQKLLVMLGGILFNLMFAYAALSFLFYTGMPKSELLYPLNASSKIVTIEPGSAAHLMRLEPGDVIQSIDSLAITNPKSDQPESTVLDMIRYINSKPGEQVTLTIERQGIPLTITGTLGTKTVGNKKIGSLGITAFEVKQTPATSFFDAIKKGFSLTNTIILSTAYAFKNIFSRGDVSGMGGPISIITQTAHGASLGFKIFLVLLSIISINLAVLNLIPLPILDGGQIVFYTIEAIIRRPINEKAREYIHIACWFLIMGLIVYLSYKDIVRLITGFISK